MANAWFQFKQFTIYQQNCAMKVCTDACIFGAYIALREKNAGNDETCILDIGAGTGLLSLMVAQQLKGRIEAVEIDEKAYQQAAENFSNSAWKPRLSICYADINEIRLDKQYTIIISNPPFFKNSLKSSNQQKNLARHNASLSYENLVSIACANLTSDGRFYILLSFEEFKAFEKLATENKLSLIEKTDIRPNATLKFFRTIGVFTKKPVDAIIEKRLIIRDNNNDYAKDFVELLKDYYLNL